MGLLGSLTSGLGLGIQQASTATNGLTQAEMERLKAEYMRMQLQNQQAYSTQTWGAYQNSTPVPIDIPTHNLEEGAWDVPVSQLVDLWVVRFGSRWVNHEELDEFYKVTTQRLRPLNKLESHYVNGKDVYRIVE